MWAKVNRRTRFLVLVLVLVACVGCDQATKAIARETLASSPPQSLLNGIVRLEYAENVGAFMSLGANLSPAVRLPAWVILVGVLLAMEVVFIGRSQNLRIGQLLGLSLIAGGGCGNLIDRLMNAGAVVDWVSLGIGSLRTGVFNLADVAIMAGGVMFLLDAWKRE
jgi:signal peptidase II